MAVQQNKKSLSKRGMHRAHDFLSTPPLAVEPTTGEVHLRHHVSPNGFYRGKKVVKTKADGKDRAAANTGASVTVRIAIDCMGGDHGLSVTVPAALDFSSRSTTRDCCWSAGRTRSTRRWQSPEPSIPPASRCVTPEVVAMDDPPAAALRSKRDSSMRVAIELVKSGDADACVSAATPAR